MGNEIEPYDPHLPAQAQVARAIREAQALSGRPVDGGQVHVHHHYAPAAAAPAPVVPPEQGPLDRHGQWLVFGIVALPVAAGAVAIVLGAVAGIVFLAMSLFGVIVTGFQAVAGSVMMLGIVAVLGIAAWKAPSKAAKGKK